MEIDDGLVRVLAGDKAAFGDLVERHRPEAVQLARRLLHRAADAEDAVQGHPPAGRAGRSTASAGRTCASISKRRTPSASI